MKASRKKLLDGLRNITIIDLACKSANIFEKTLWILIGTIGAIYAIYFISFQFLTLEKQSSVLVQEDGNLVKLKFPAITICPKVSTKYGIAERLGNYIDPEKLPEKLLSLKFGFFKCVFGSPLVIIENDYDVESTNSVKSIYKNSCVNNYYYTPDYCKVQYIYIFEICIFKWQNTASRS